MQVINKPFNQIDIKFLKYNSEKIKQEIISMAVKFSFNSRKGISYINSMKDYETPKNYLTCRSLKKKTKLHKSRKISEISFKQ